MFSFSFPTEYFTHGNFIQVYSFSTKYLDKHNRSHIYLFIYLFIYFFIMMDKTFPLNNEEHMATIWWWNKILTESKHDLQTPHRHDMALFQHYVQPHFGGSQLTEFLLLVCFTYYVLPFTWDVLLPLLFNFALEYIIWRV